MPIELKTDIEPAVWSAQKMQDLTIRLVLKNTSEKPITLYPVYTQLSWKVSVSNLGATWKLEFETPGGQTQASGHELRTYYGPPGEPVSPEAIEKSARILKPGRETTARFHACWIPGKLLSPEQLSLPVLDPEGYDNLKSVPNLEQSSVLVFNARSSELKNGLKNRKDFLRGYMVVFFSGTRTFLLKTGFRQEPVLYPFMERLEAVAEPVKVVVEPE